MLNLKPETQGEEPKTSKTFTDPKDSFFDDDEIDLDPFDNSRKLWIKPQKTHLSCVKTPNILCEGLMAKKGKKMKLKKLRYYILTADFLAYKEKVDGGAVKKIMLLERTRLDFAVKEKKGKEPKFCFYFMRNKRLSKIYTRDQTLYEKFKDILARLCILSSFMDDYKVQKLVGQGSYGKVYLVKRKSDEQLFAAKMFQKQVLLSESKGKASLINEVRILRKLNHPGIMRLYEVHETNVTICLIMELLEGGELFERLDATKTYSESDCALMFRKILEPLVYMHQNEIMHRDIKPENLILRSKASEYDIVIADLGLAQEMKKKFLHIRCGTPGYCAPEILASKAHKPEYDLKVDVFSVGCVFYQIITGNLPFVARNMKEMFELNRKCEISFENPKIHALSPPAQNLLQLMLARDPSKRPTLAQCLSHEFFFEASKKVSGVVLSFVHQSILFGARTMPTPKGEGNNSNKAFGSSHEELLGFVLGKPNMIRGRLDTIEEITVMSAAVGIQQMLGIDRTQSQKEIQQKLSKRFTTAESRTKLATFNDMPIKHQPSRNENEDVDNISESSLQSDNSIHLNKDEQQSLTVNRITSGGRAKRKKVANQMNKLAEQVQAHMQNPFLQDKKVKGA